MEEDVKKTPTAWYTGGENNKEKKQCMKMEVQGTSSCVEREMNSGEKARNWRRHGGSWKIKKDVTI